MMFSQTLVFPPLSVLQEQIIFSLQLSNNILRFASLFLKSFEEKNNPPLLKEKSVSLVVL